MQKPIFILLICLLASPILAQNFLFSYSGGGYEEIMPLQTDSLYRVRGTQSVESAFKFDANHRIIKGRYRSIESAQNFEFRTITTVIYTPNKVISIDTSIQILPFSNISVSRRTTDSLDGRVVFIYAENWDGTKWQGVQKDSFIYNANFSQMESASQSWDFVDMAWKYNSFQQIEYDAQGRILIRREWGVGNSITDTTYYNDYFYAYNIDGQLTSLTSRYGTSPVNNGRETYVYDTNGNLDSLIIAYWNTVLLEWRLDNIRVLDDSPEQQATVDGKIYRLNNLSQWYLDSESFYTPGPQIYTNEPIEVLTKKFNANSNQLQDYKRKGSTYTVLPDGRIKGDYQQAIFSNGSWKDELHVETWQHKLETVGVKTPEAIPPPSCGIPNPLTGVDLRTISPEFSPDAQLEIFSLDGRLVLSQNLNKDFTLDVSGKPTGIYWLFLREKANIICVQKVLLH